MASDIRIGVRADTRGVQQDLTALQRAFNQLGREAQRAGRIEFKPVSREAVDDLKAIAASFEQLVRMSPGLRSTLAAASQQGRALQDIDWRRVFPDERQRRGYAETLVRRLDPRQHVGGHRSPPPRPPGDSGAGGASGGGGQGHADVVRRGMASAGGLAKGALALAGVMGTMSMAGRAVDLAREEAIAQDQLLRGTGDLNREFRQLRDEVRISGRDLGVAFTEAAGMARHYARVANVGDEDDIGDNLRTGFGMARAYGLELSEGVSFMAQARHFGAISSDDANGRRFALMIAEAIERGQSTAKAGEMLEAIANYTSTIARAALTPADARLYAGALAGLTSTHTPGLDPEGASALLGRADAAMRAGGGMGEAGQNFTYAALLRQNPGINPIMARAIAEQGLFGSGESLGQGPYAEYLRRNGRLMPLLSGQSNLTTALGLINEEYADPHMRLDAIRNFFNLGSYGHAAALANMEPERLGDLERLLTRAGVEPEQITASGLQNLGAIGAADDERLRRYADRIMARDDLVERDRRRIGEALGEEDIEALREELVRIVAAYEQEKNVATETRDGVAEINNTLTTIGAGLLPAVAGIQRLVGALAKEVAPDDPYVRHLELQQGMGVYARRRVEHVETIERQREDLEALKARQLEENPNPAWWGDSWRRREELISDADRAFWERHRDEEAFLRQHGDQAAVLNVDDATRQLYERLNRSERRHAPIDLDLDGAGRVPDTPGERRLSAGAVIGPVRITGEELATLEWAAEGDPAILKAMKAALALENWGFGEVRYGERSPKGAQGPFQFMPATAAAYGVEDPSDFEQSAAGAAWFLRDLLRQYDGDMRAALAHYNGGTRAGRLVAQGGLAPSAETRQYVDRFDQLTHGGHLPAGHRDREQQLREPRMHVDFASPVVRIEDMRGNELAEPVELSVNVGPPHAAGVR